VLILLGEVYGEAAALALRGLRKATRERVGAEQDEPHQRPAGDRQAEELPVHRGRTRRCRRTASPGVRVSGRLFSMKNRSGPHCGNLVGRQALQATPVGWPWPRPRRRTGKSILNGVPPQRPLKRAGREEEKHQVEETSLHHAQRAGPVIPARIAGSSRSPTAPRRPARRAQT